MSTNPRELQTRIVTVTTVPYKELDRFITLHIGKPYECIVGGSWRNGTKNGVDLDALGESDRADAIADVTEWLAGTGSYRKPRPGDEYPSPYAVLSYLRRAGIAVPTRMLVEVSW